MSLHPVIAFDVSMPLRDVPWVAPTDDGEHEVEDHRVRNLVDVGPPVADAVLQNAMPHAPMAPPILNIDGQGLGFTGPDGPFKLEGTPPDPNGDVGPNHFIQTVNTSYTIFDKTGKALLGPRAINTLWKGFGGDCEQNNDGDPVVQYDQLADRWVISQFALPNAAPYFQCVAVSTSPDPTGTYYRFKYQFASLNDYPKLAVWPDGYYMTYNDDNQSVCAMNRMAMLVGNASGSTQQCFTPTGAGSILLAADLDGHLTPPTGTPNYLIGRGQTAAHDLTFWKLKVDWAAPANSKLDGPTHLVVAAYNRTTGDQVVQPGGAALDAIDEWPMYRLAYRKFADHESLVINHTVAGTAAGAAGVRWYEIRVANGTPSVYQQGTYSPDTTSRWMGSAAMDKDGNLAIGYSATSSTVNPSARYAGRAASDPLGTLGQAEVTLAAGKSAQTSLDRWGDYASLSIDPLDDCTFWYTGEYMAASGKWATRIAAFRFPSCTGASTVDGGTADAGEVVDLGLPPPDLAAPTDPTDMATGGGGPPDDLAKQAMPSHGCGCTLVDDSTSAPPRLFLFSLLVVLAARVRRRSKAR